MYIYIHVIYMYIYTYMYIYMYICIHAAAHGAALLAASIVNARCVCVCVCVFECASACVCAHVWVYVRMCAQIRPMCVCTCMCMWCMLTSLLAVYIILSVAPPPPRIFSASPVPLFRIETNTQALAALLGTDADAAARMESERLCEKLFRASFLCGSDSTASDSTASLPLRAVHYHLTRRPYSASVPLWLWKVSYIYSYMHICMHIYSYTYIAFSVGA